MQDLTWKKKNANITDTRRQGEQNSTTGSLTALTGAKSGAQQHNTLIPRLAHAPCTFAAILRREEEEEEKAVPSCRQRELTTTGCRKSRRSGSVVGGFGVGAGEKRGWGW